MWGWVEEESVQATIDTRRAITDSATGFAGMYVNPIAALLLREHLWQRPYSSQIVVVDVRVVVVVVAVELQLKVKNTYIDTRTLLLQSIDTCNLNDH